MSLSSDVNALNHFDPQNQIYLDVDSKQDQLITIHKDDQHPSKKQRTESGVKTGWTNQSVERVVHYLNTSNHFTSLPLVNPKSIDSLLEVFTKYSVSQIQKGKKCDRTAEMEMLKIKMGIQDNPFDSEEVLQLYDKFNGMDKKIQFLKAYRELDEEKKEWILASRSRLLDFQNKFEIPSMIDAIIQLNQEYRTFISSTHPNPLKIGDSLQVAPIPRTFQEYRSNLRLFLENSPRYLLGVNLDVYDTNSHPLPQDWDSRAVFQNLKQTSLTIHSSVDTPLNMFQLTELNLLLKESANVFREKTVVSFEIIRETEPIGTKNDALYTDAAEFIIHRKPLVANRQLFKAHAKQFNNLKQKVDFDFYLHPEGGICLAIPKNRNLTNLGFESDSLIKWEGKSFDELKDAEEEDFVIEMSLLLKPDQEDRQFYRIIALSGHGRYPGAEYGQKNVKGEAILKDFDELGNLLETLQSHNMVFCALNACYLGGVNASKIHLPDQTISCPMVLMSSLETETFAERVNVLPLLNSAQKHLFPPNKKLIQPRSLTPKHFKSISKDLNHHVLIFNIPSYIIPKNQPDVPTVISTLLKEESDIVDASQAMKTNEMKTFIGKKAVFFSEPIIPKSMNFSGSQSIKLLSRGANTFHVINEINFPGMELSEVGENTFNYEDYPSGRRSSVKDFDSPVTKVFFIQRMQCLIMGELNLLQHVMIKKSPAECLIIYQPQGFSDFEGLGFEMNQDRSWACSGEIEVDLLSAHSEMYQAMDSAMPSEKTLEMTTGGKLNKQALLENFNTLMWENQMPLDAQLESAILLNTLNFKKVGTTIHQSTLLEQILSKIEDRFYLNSEVVKDQLLEILIISKDFAEKLNKTEELQLVKELIYKLQIARFLNP